MVASRRCQDEGVVVDVEDEGRGPGPLAELQDRVDEFVVLAAGGTHEV